MSLAGASKSEATWFYDWRHREAPPPGLCLDINGQDVEVGLRMKIWASPSTINGRSGRTSSTWSPKWRQQPTPYVACCWISVGPGSKCADYMRESFVPGSCTSDLYDDPGDSIERCGPSQCSNLTGGMAPSEWEKTQECSDSNLNSVSEHSCWALGRPPGGCNR